MKEKICGFDLDEQQESIVLDESKYLLVVAGAGSGKTLTILGKINYLINYKGIKESEIICISFTKATTDSLKNKINSEFSIDIQVYTFHKLSLEILKDYNINYVIANEDTLDYIIEEFLYVDVMGNKKMMEYVCLYFNIKYKNIDDYLNLLDSKEMFNLKKLIVTFIRLFKCNGNELDKFNNFLNKARFNIFSYRKEKIFLMIVFNVYINYSYYLADSDRIDFDDMIIRATKLIKEKGLFRTVKYIIIDEYQDSSLVRFNLIWEILCSSGASLMVVGDDFQSIYRFTGCDLSLFLNFKKYFKGAKILKIENTYRNSQELISVAGNFVMKNKRQIYKKLKSNKKLNRPISIIYYDNIKEEFYNLINYIANNCSKNILVLGRNNNDINMLVDDNYFCVDGENIILFDNKDIKIRYLTVHKSKGLEEENVIIINLIDRINGFPNKIVNDKVLRFVSNNKEKYPYSEERRLFYVALTRTKNSVFLLVPKKCESIFITELKHDYKNKIKVIEGVNEL